MSASIVLAMMLREPEFRTVPYRSTFEATAVAIAEVAERSPLFEGEDGVLRTEAVLVATARYESGFRPDAQGDCDRTDRRTGMCEKGSTPHSFCLFQIGESNFRYLGVTRAEILGDVRVCALAAARMMRQSFGVCRGRPVDERLAQYASGGPACGGPQGQGVAKSRTRMALARRLVSYAKEFVAQREG